MLDPEYSRLTADTVAWAIIDFAQGIIYSTRDETWVSHVHGKYVILTNGLSLGPVL